MAGLLLGGCGIKDKVTDKVENKIDKAEKSLRELIAGGQAQKCTITTSNEGKEVVSEMWIKGKKFKQTTKSTSFSPDGTEMTVNLISDGGWIYSWNDKTETGMKIKIEESEKEDAEVKNNLKGAGAIDLDQKVKYDCRVANIGDSEFVPPTNVKFVDWQAEAATLKEKMEEQLKGFGIPTEGGEE